MRKTLAKGGRGDKMAAALMKHIEKERKKVWSSAALLHRGVRRPPTQRGEWGLRPLSPTGGFPGPGAGAWTGLQKRARC